MSNPIKTKEASYVGAGAATPCPAVRAHFALDQLAGALDFNALTLCRLRND